jgi:hypothetical protein
MDVKEEYDFITNPVIELEDNVKVIKWYETNYELYLTENKLELFRKKLMKNLTEIISLDKIKKLLIEFIIRQSVLNVYSLIEFAYEYIGLLLPEHHSKETIPSLYMMFELFEIDSYEHHIDKHGKEISIKQHDIMMELPMDILKTLYGLPTKISQIYRALFPNTWAQAYFNFTTDIIIHPTKDEKMIVIVHFKYYHGYIDHPNTHTLLDNVRTVQFLKNHYTVLELVNEYMLDAPFPTIYGVSTAFIVDDDNMSVKISCYHPELSFGNKLKYFECSEIDLKIPGDSTFGYLTNKNAFDPHQYHYILRRLSRYLYEYPYVPYNCIMCEDDLPYDIMYFHV